MDKARLVFKKGEIEAGIAGSFLEKAIGLSFRSGIGDGEGLVFDFGRACRPVFWNFGMCFPIDVIWLKDGGVVGIEKGVPAMDDGLKIFYPRGKADSAVELAAGSAERLGVALHDTIKIIR